MEGIVKITPNLDMIKLNNLTISTIWMENRLAHSPKYDTCSLKTKDHDINILCERFIMHINMSQNPLIIYTNSFCLPHYRKSQFFRSVSRNIVNKYRIIFHLNSKFVTLY